MRRCLIANRGEIAVRVIRACRELGIEATALYTQPDADAPHVGLADFAYPVASYLEPDALLQTAQAAGCDAVHPGYGFLSENAAFAQAVLDAGLTWVGPAPATIAQMGVKTTARALMQAAGVPLVPGYQPGPDETPDVATFTAEAERIGYPVMVKAAGGGGGKGIRIVHDADGLPDALESARREAQKAFNDPRLFLEKYIERGRHIEVQVIADAHGNTRHLFERECSVQRRHQKIIEETPSPLLDDATRQAITAAAIDAAQAVDYVNAGTVEFIVTPERDFYFLEMNTRLQVEHPITEMVTGVDLVTWQLRVAAGEALSFAQDALYQQGHAIECRLYAEDPHNNFLPATGTIHRWQAPVMPGVRVDAGVQSGDAITIHYDPMIAKVIVHAATREAAIRRMRAALHETVVLGTTTNADFLLALLDSPAFIAGEVDTGYVDRHLEDLLPEPSGLPALALIALALAEADSAPGLAAGDDQADRYSPWNQTDGFRLRG
jgi:3-methylcrotonyl-CoA carboxylase alpha subunit